jgi:hypothetical protein
LRTENIDYRLGEEELMHTKVEWSVKSLKHGLSFLRKYFDSKE